MNFISGGRGGPATVLLGLFIMAITLALKVLLYLFAAAVAVVLLAGAGVRALWRSHKDKAEVRDEQAKLLNPPMPPASPVE